VITTDCLIRNSEELETSSYILMVNSLLIENSKYLSFMVTIQQE